MKITAFHGTKNKFNKFELKSNISNNTYGGTIDNGLGIFFTDNEIMAKWFGQAIEYSSDDDGYVNTDTQAYLITAELILNKPLEFKNENEKFDDSYQQYFEFIEKIGGAEICREKLLSAGYDSIIIYNADTNYYGDGTYDAYVILKLENIKIISNIELNTNKNLNQQANTNGELYTTETYSPESKIDYKPTINSVPLSY